METDIAIIGMSGRFPEADNVEEFWENLISGRDSVRSPPKERKYMIGSKDLKAGYMKCPVDEFDLNFFNISPKEGPYIDPQQRLFLEVSWESLEDAGIPPTSLSGTKTGVFLGTGGDDSYRRNYLTAVGDEKMYTLLGNMGSAATGRLSYFLNLRGPSIPLEVTCASSALAVHTAVQSLKNGECSLAIAGGVAVILETDTVLPDNLISSKSRSFSSEAAGFAPAEGCGMVILQPLGLALAAGKRIHGIIRGTGTNHTGRSPRYGAPQIDAEETVIRETLRSAGVEPSQVSYIEAHAGGTYLGDPIEFKAIANVFGNGSRDHPIILTCCKPNIGHAMNAAGIVGLIKALLCIKHKSIPPHLHLRELHPEIDLSIIPAIIPTVKVALPNNSVPLIASVNCFGLTGANVHMVIQEPPKQIQTSAPSTLKHHLLTFSAKDELALEKLRQKYAGALETAATDGIPLADFIFSANTARDQFGRRVAVIGTSYEELSRKLRNKHYFQDAVDSGKRNGLVFMFTGHGCQYAGMGKELYAGNGVFKEAIDACDAIYQEELGISLKEFLWADEAHDLTITKYSQPAIFALEYALFQFWTSLGLKPSLVIGHSIGEYAATVAAGILSMEDALRLVCYRSKAINDLPEGGMMTISAPASLVKPLINEFMNENPCSWVDLACENSLEQSVVSMPIESADEFTSFLAKRAPSLKTRIIQSQHAFHSRAMDPILEDYEKFANENMTVNMPTTRIISGMLSAEIGRNDMSGLYWRNHCRQPVLFSQALDRILHSENASFFLEVSPEPILLNFLKTKTTKDMNLLACPSIRRGQDEWLSMLTTMAKLYVKSPTTWNFASFLSGNIVDLPKYAFNRKHCWASPKKQMQLGNPGDQCHSLLGTRLSLPDDIRFLNYLSGSNSPYIRDHRVLNYIVVPGACYVEMLMAIAANDYNQKVIVLEDFEISSALVLSEEDESRVQTVSYGVTNKSVSLQIFSDSAEKKTVRHARGNIRLGEDFSSVFGTDGLVDMEELKAKHSQELTSEAVYNHLDSVGLNMGPLFRSLATLHYNADMSQFLTSFPSRIHHGSDFVCHPIILDAVIQSICLFKFRSTEGSSFGLPVGFERFVMNPNWANDCTEYLYFHVAGEHRGTLYNSRGKALAVMNGFTVLRTTKPAFLKSIGVVNNLPQFISKSLEKLNFEFAPPPLHSSDTRPMWLIFGSREDPLQKDITAKLEKIGRTIVSIQVGSRFERSNGVFTVNPLQPDDFKDLVHVFQNGGSVEGVLYMWGMTESREKVTELGEMKHVLAKITSGLLHLFQIQANNNWKMKLVVVTLDSKDKNPAQGALWGLHETYACEFSDFDSLAIDLDGENDTTTSADQVLSLLFQKIEERGIYFKGNDPMGFRLKNLESSLPETQFQIPNSAKFKLTDITSLKFDPIQNQEQSGIEIAVKAVGLNSRDSLLSLSLLETTHPDSAGLEFSGVVTSVDLKNCSFQVGDRVAGVTASGGIRSHIVVSNPKSLFKISSEMSFAAAATLPVAYITSYMSMVTIANVKPAERILIHTASGGVGISAIHLARLLGAEIFATAGSEKKRRYLRDCLGVSHVYNSRTQAYHQEILNDTNGEGVHVILNTLTGQGFKEASLACLAPGGKFVELSKLNIWTHQGVSNLRSDVTYTIYDAFALMLEEDEGIFSAYEALAKLFLDRKLNTLPYIIYPLAQIQNALKCFQNFNHIGKIVLEIPETAEQMSKVSLFNGESTYVVTGGLGSVGFEVGKHIYKQGGNVILIGRSKISDEKAQALLGFQDRMNYVQCDIGNYESVKCLFRTLRPPVRGVFHCAIGYANGVIPRQSAEMLATSFQAKVYGTWILHELTKSLPLEHFVTFSSVASIFGGIGLADYTAASRYMDSLARYRTNQCGLPSTNINWGIWGEVGEASDVGMFKNVHGFSTVTGLEALDQALRLRINDVMFADFDYNGLHKIPKSAVYLSLLAGSNGSENGQCGPHSVVEQHVVEANIFKLHEEAISASPADQIDKMQDFLEAALKQHMGNYDSELLDRNKSFALMGMDSLIGMELRITVNELLGVKLDPNAVQEFDTISNLAKYLTNHLNTISQNGSDGRGVDGNDETNTQKKNNPSYVHSKKSSDGKGKWKSVLKSKWWRFDKKRLTA